MRTTLILLVTAPLACTAPDAVDDEPHAGFRALESHADPARLAQSNIGIAIKAYGALPGSVAEWRKALAPTPGGIVNDFAVPFSRAPGKTHLAQPRILMNVSRPEMKAMRHLPAGRGATGNASGLYLGFIHHPSEGASEVEFISYNRQHQAFDFGVIHDMGLPQARVEFVADSACTGCHMANAPIFPDQPWPNTTSNPAVFRAMVQRIAAVYTSYAGLEAKVAALVAANPNGRAAALLADTDVRAAKFDGTLLLPQQFAFTFDSPMGRFDASSVAFEAQYLRVHQYIAQLPGPEVREAVVEAMVHRYFHRHTAFDAESSLATLKAAHTADALRADHCGVLPSQRPTSLVPFNPVTGLSGTKVNEKAIEPAAVAAVLEYDAARRAGTAVVPDQHQPSNPIAYNGLFEEADVKLYIDGENGTFDPLNAIGMTDVDAEFMLKPFRLVMQQKDPAKLDVAMFAALFNDTKVYVDSPYPTTGALRSPAVKALIKRGKLPPREELMLAVIAGLNTFFKAEYGFTRDIPAASYVHPGITPIDLAHEPADPHGPPCAAPVTNPCTRCHFPGSARTLQYDSTSKALWTAKLAIQPFPAHDGTMLMQSLRRVLAETMPPEAATQEVTFFKPIRGATITMLCDTLAALKPVDERYVKAHKQYCAGLGQTGLEGGEDDEHPCCDDPDDACAWRGDTFCDQGCAWGDDPDCAGGESGGDGDGDGDGDDGGETGAGASSSGSETGGAGESSTSGASSTTGTSGGESSTSGGSSTGGESTSSTGGESSSGTSTGDASSGGATSGASSGGESTSGASSGDSSGDGSSGSDSSGATDSSTTAGASTGSTTEGASTGSDTSSDTSSDGSTTDTDTGGDVDDMCGVACEALSSDECAEHCCAAPELCDEGEQALCIGMCEWCVEFICELDDDADDTTGGGTTGVSDTFEDPSAGDSADDTSTGGTSTGADTTGGPVHVPKGPILFDPWPWGF